MHESRLKILNATLNVVREKGYHATRIEDVCAAAGLTKNGTGPAMILVGGTLDDGAENAPLAELLADHFTVYNYARRGRGGSGNTPPYALAREVEDLDALIATAGGSAHVYGASSGGALALEAAAAGSAIDKIAVWDVPYVIGDDQWHTLDGQGHVVAPELMARVLKTFFNQ